MTRRQYNARAPGGEVKFDIPHRIVRVYGRQLGILGADGSRSTVAVFDYKGRLFSTATRSVQLSRVLCGPRSR